ncbi:hypothetical protein HPB52_017598 [Rhipicephalus sanguineus]|uniref:Uncharacterized protein n=1 Tax=Rhipicephalus sanguineus TaxID=34632 RepID=A0A9D4T0Y9_RHISA|nr:hypothetical protein HPB52_017598 [Rhipicephalus sanguineus]
MTVLCRSAEEASQWKAKLSFSPPPPPAPSPLRRVVAQVSAPTPAPTVTVVRPMETPVPQRPLPVMIGPSTERTPLRESSSTTQSGGWCLRPHPPLRPRPTVGRAPNRHHKQQRKPGPAEDRAPHVDDMQLLQVIEAYCGSSSRARHTVNSALMNCPQVLVAEDEKIIVEDTKGMEERSCYILLILPQHDLDATFGMPCRSLVDTVYALRDQVKELRTVPAQWRKAGQLTIVSCLNVVHRYGVGDVLTLASGWLGAGVRVQAGSSTSIFILLIDLLVQLVLSMAQMKPWFHPFPGLVTMPGLCYLMALF